MTYENLLNLSLVGSLANNHHGDVEVDITIYSVDLYLCTKSYLCSGGQWLTYCPAYYLSNLVFHKMYIALPRWKHDDVNYSASTTES
jgi:hypothetical protein